MLPTFLVYKLRVHILFNKSVIHLIKRMKIKIWAKECSIHITAWLSFKQQVIDATPTCFRNLLYNINLGSINWPVPKLFWNLHQQIKMPIQWNGQQRCSESDLFKRHVLTPMDTPCAFIIENITHLKRLFKSNIATHWTNDASALMASNKELEVVLLQFSFNSLLTYTVEYQEKYTRLNSRTLITDLPTWWLINTSVAAIHHLARKSWMKWNTNRFHCGAVVHCIAIYFQCTQWIAIVNSAARCPLHYLLWETNFTEWEYIVLRH